MKNLFKLIVLAILTIFAFNFSYVYATEQESENIEEGIEEVIKPVASDNVSNSDNKSDNKEEVESKSETPSRNTTDGTNNETEETSEVGETKTEETNTQQPAKTEEPVKSEEPTNDVEEPTRDEEEPTEPTVGKVNVRIIDSRTGDLVTTIELSADATSNTQISVKQLFSSIGDSGTTAFIINEKLYTHKFIGFYDAASGGNLITSSYSNSTLYPNLERITANSTITSASNYKLTLRAKSDITTETTVDVYARFETTAKPNGKITINVIDSRTGDVVDSLITYATDTSADSRTLKALFPNIHTSGTRLEDKLNDKTYIFKGFFTGLDGETQITKNFTPGETYPELKTLKVSNDLTTSNWQNHRLQALSNSTNATDNTYNVYALWDEKPSTKLTIVFKELSESGTELNDTQNEVQRSVTNTIELGNSQTQRSEKLKVTQFISGDYRYIVDGWYEEDGVTPVPSSMYVNGDPLQIAVPYKCTEDSPKELTLTYILKWKEYLNPKYSFNVIDEVSNGDHHWDNTDGHFGTYTYTFKKPADKNHYKFLYYKMDDITKNAGEKYNHDIDAQGYGTEVEETFNAWWKADVTLILIDGNDKLGEKSQFDSISIRDVIDSNPTKAGYEFLGWKDEDGNLYDLNDSFDANDPSTNPEPKTITLTAEWKRIMRNVYVTKIWNDAEDADEIRPDSVTVHINDKNGVVDTVELSEENGWEFTFSVPKFDGEDTIEYFITEDEVPEYETEITGDIENGFEITNTHLGMGDGGEEYDEDGLPPQTGYDSNYIVQFVLLVFGIMSVYAVRKF